MDHNHMSADILDAAIKIHRHFGPGMLESAYERLPETELLKRGLSVKRQKRASFEYGYSQPPLCASAASVPLCGKAGGMS